MIDGWGISCKITLSWMSLNFSDDQSRLVQVMAWCRQATSHYLNQCWHRSLSPYGIIRPQWVNSPRQSNASVYCDIIGCDDVLSPVCPQFIIWTKADILLNGPLGTNFSESLRRIQFSYKKLICLVLSHLICMLLGIIFFRPESIYDYIIKPLI